MRKSIRFTIVMMMAVVFCMAAAVTASAAPTGTAAAGSGLGTLKHPISPVGNSEEKYMQSAALVMFRATDKVSNGTAKKALRSGEKGISDIEIEEIWNFETEPEITSVEDGNRKTVKGAGKSISWSNVALVRSKTLTTEQLVRKMKARRDVIYAEPNYRIHACSVDDPYFGSQWSMQGGPADSADYNEYTPNVSAAWAQGTTGSERIVAVVDTGVDYTHPDLKNRMWRNNHYPTLKGDFGYDFIAGDEDPMDENGHGTHCAGIIGAQGNNGIGICGVNQDIRIMALRMLDAYGSSYLSHEIAAYNYINKALDLGEPVQAINNSWGGGEDSDIFAALIDVVGKKGAITVCAAGNSSSDNDEYEEYPCNIDSPYLINVAATREDGELASFSNYGRKTVDVAAPGTDILSTAVYDCYNPSIYGSSQESISAKFNDYETGAGGWGDISDLQANMYLNGEKYTGGDGRKISLSLAGDGFTGKPGKPDGHSLSLKAQGLKSGDLLCLTLPYEITKDAKIGPSFSMMTKGKSTIDGMMMLGVTEMPQGEIPDMGTLYDLPLWGMYLFRDDFDNWNHIGFDASELYDLDEVLSEAADARERGDDPEQDPAKRQITLLLYAEAGGNAEVQVDDIGMSRQDLPGTEVFGAYEYMNGTSMAAPFISGAVALQAAAMYPEYSSTDGKELVGEVVSMARTGNLKIIPGGSFDFTKRPAELSPRIGSIRVDKVGGTLTISGTGLAPSTGLKVEIGPDEESLKEAQVLSRSALEVVVKDENWINNVETVRITGYDGKTSTYSDTYLVKGKKNYTWLKNVEYQTTGEAMTTDGKYIYEADSKHRCIVKIDPRKFSRDNAPISSVDPARLFGKNKSKYTQDAMKFGSDLVYMNGKLYTVVEYGEADEVEPVEDEFWFFRKGSSSKGSSSKGSAIETEDEEESGEMGIYSGDFRLISIDTKSGKVQNLGRLPSDLRKTVDYSVAVYNGKLLFMGGFSYENHDLTTAVKIYDPAKKKSKRWSAGKSLPRQRAGGKALQSGSKLIYTLGYCQPLEEDNYRYPVNLIYNGKGWSVSKAPASGGIEPLWEEETVIRAGKTYVKPSASIGAVKNGLIYFGMPVADYGDTFLYNAASDSYTDTGYNYISNLDSEEIRGIAVGGRVYGFDEDFVYTAKMKTGSNLVKISVKKNAGGRVTGTKTVPAGNNAVLIVKAKKGHVIKSIRAAGKTVRVKNRTKQKVVLKNVVKNQTVKVKFGRQ